MKRVELIIV